MPKPRKSFNHAARALAIAVTTLAFAACGVAKAGEVVDPTGWTHEENSALGRSYFSAKTFVDCTNTRVGYRQSADIFSGGYTHDAAGNVVSYADMGIILENNDLEPGQIAAPNKVQLYGQGSTNGFTQTLRFSNDGNASQRFFNVVCDTPLTLTFWVESESKIAIRYDGTFASKFGGKRFVRSLTTAIDGFAPADGWTTACARCQVRRVTTLAVSGGDPIRRGAYFAVRDTGAKREPTGMWRDSVVGTYRSGVPGSVASYDIAPFTSRARDVNDSPTNGQRFPVERPEFLIGHQGEPAAEFGLDQR